MRSQRRDSPGNLKLLPHGASSVLRVHREHLQMLAFATLAARPSCLQRDPRGSDLQVADVLMSTRSRPIEVSCIRSRSLNQISP